MISKLITTVLMSASVITTPAITNREYRAAEEQQESIEFDVKNIDNGITYTVTNPDGTYTIFEVKYGTYFYKDVNVTVGYITRTHYTFLNAPYERTRINSYTYAAFAQAKPNLNIEGRTTRLEVDHQFDLEHNIRWTENNKIIVPESTSSGVYKYETNIREQDFTQEFIDNVLDNDNDIQNYTPGALDHVGGGWGSAENQIQSGYLDTNTFDDNILYTKNTINNFSFTTGHNTLTINSINVNWHVHVNYWYYPTAYPGYEVIDIGGLMLTILSLPFNFISQAFNVTLFAGTPYAINFANLFKGLIAVLTVLLIVKIFTKGLNALGEVKDSSSKDKNNNKDKGE